MPIIQRRTHAFRRRLNRTAVGLFCLFAFYFVYSQKQQSWQRSVEIPILGSNPSQLLLYFPPLGHDFHPKVARYNVYRDTHPRTPLLIPFTRNNTMLKQAVLSYIAAGWPRNDIVVVDNTGTMDANNKQLLTEENPFFLDYELFRRRYGVAILQTPTLLNFAQLQNFFLRTALARDWPFYFWSHMDIAVLSAEDLQPYKSFYHRVIDVLDSTGLDQYAMVPPYPDISDPEPVPPQSFKGGFEILLNNLPKPLATLKKRLHRRRQWAVKFFDFDNLALINVEAWKRIGPWDVFIPYYNTDCDAYARIAMHGYRKDDVQAGYVFDIAGVVEDPEIRFFPSEDRKDRSKWGLSPEGPEPDGGKLDSPRFQWLKGELQELMDQKESNQNGRNTWQVPLADGKPRKLPEQWSYDSKAFQTAWWAMADYGRQMYIRKWGTLECDLTAENKTLKDAWLGEHLKEGTDAFTRRVMEEEYWRDFLKTGDIR